MGNLTLSNVSEDQLSFMIVEETFEKSLMTQVLNYENAREVFKFYLYKPHDVDEYRILIGSIDIQLKSQDGVILERVHSYESEKAYTRPILSLDYEVSRDNSYIAMDTNLNRTFLTDKEDQSKYLTTKDLVGYVRADKSILYPTEKSVLEGLALRL